MDESTLDFLAERKGFWFYPDDNDTTREKNLLSHLNQLQKTLKATYLI